MSDPNSEDGALPDDIRALLRGEQQPIAPPSGARDAVLDRVFSSVGLAPLPHTTPPPPTVATAASATSAASPLISWVGGALVAAAILGGGASLYRSTRAESAGSAMPTQPATHAPSARPPTSPPSQSPPTTVHPSAPSTTHATDAGIVALASSTPEPPARRRVAQPQAAETPEDLAEEHRMLSAAQRALTQRDANAALASVRAHSQRFAHGALAEERDALEIRALLLADREQDARSLAQRFRRRYPDSVFIATIDERLGRP